MCEFYADGTPRDYAKERAAYDERCKAIASAANALRRNELSRIAARFEFESDQYMTAEQKAERYLQTGQISPRY